MPAVTNNKELEVPAKFAYKKQESQDRYKRRGVHNKSMDISYKTENSKLKKFEHYRQRT